MRPAVIAHTNLRKKLIEVALPLDATNTAAAREKSIRHGHPSTLHLWWARRPLAAARAEIFVQFVDDPSEYVDVLLSDPAKKRAALRALRKRRASGGRAHRAWPTMCATTAGGCAMRRRNGSGICTRRSRSRRRWCGSVPI